MAVEEVGPRLVTRNIAHSRNLQEFTIEIPDAEADEIKTVRHGKPPPTLGVYSRF